MEIKARGAKGERGNFLGGTVIRPVLVRFSPRLSNIRAKLRVAVIFTLAGR